MRSASQVTINDDVHSTRLRDIRTALRRTCNRVVIRIVSRDDLVFFNVGGRRGQKGTRKKEGLSTEQT